MLSRLLREDVELILRMPDTCAKVHADPGQIEQVVMNLAVNARDAMPTGGTLTIELSDVEVDHAYAERHPGLAAGRYAKLSVTDTGVGMSAETRERLFQPFFTTKEIGKGTGLGLSTVFGVVEQSRGHVHVASELGRGTAIEVYLPATSLPEDRAAPGTDLPLIPIQGWETVLLVEDDDQVRAAARAVLTRYGYRVLEARDGVEATEQSARFRGDIHILLTDTVMPGISGPALAQQLASDRPSMKTLFMSGYTDNESIREGVLTSTVAFLSKPFTPEMLLRHVRMALSMR
jgi:CheY-like chemotaxis protein